ncbi:AMP-binding-domain-containing protein [Basidiobolus meristosporus CBS 931.73]|uniref:AMP-binding-domain-containing protein n=1 Tax=Basidiobolus meristosporus CBS 931.73 TaxID=1314790 RepID=A0A1Y1Y320_9FUNG|nr:AMP-binding-domain-containing protein [Basidiobolus meristosporus CBS 931.73]|eukprot:ORX92393.1 AMP-binding-domain-containing protein [Basidiobolus meristosporus CBS 931.73]
MARQWYDDRLFAPPSINKPRKPGGAFRDQYLTYAELDDRSSKLARHLLHLGVRQEMIVAVCMERSPFLIISYLAILKAGARIYPLIPAIPSERIEFMLTDSGCSIVLAERPSDNLPLLTSVRRLYVEQDWEVIVKEGSAAGTSPKVATPASLAYMMYTSGSTGVPKGVLIEQHSVIRLVWQRVLFPSLHSRQNSADRQYLI